MYALPSCVCTNAHRYMSCTYKFSSSSSSYPALKDSKSNYCTTKKTTLRNFTRLVALFVFC